MRSSVYGAIEPGEVIELARENLLALVQTDSELGEIIMRAFILRRVELITHGLGDAVVVGSNHCSGTLRVREFLTRNGHPYSYIDLDRVQDLLDQFHVGAEDVPVLICRGEVVLRNPTNQEIAESTAAISATWSSSVPALRDLRRPCTARRKGSTFWCWNRARRAARRARARRSRTISVFPPGISGQDLAARAYTQAQKSGAQVMIAKGAQRLTCDRKPYAIEMDDGSRVTAHAVVAPETGEPHIYRHNVSQPRNRKSSAAR